MAFPPPLDGVVDRGVTSQPFVLPEFDRDRDDDNNNNSIGFEFPNFTYAGSMELMAVPKRKVSSYLQLSASLHFLLLLDLSLEFRMVLFGV